MFHNHAARPPPSASPRCTRPDAFSDSKINRPCRGTAVGGLVGKTVGKTVGLVGKTVPLPWAF